MGDYIDDSVVGTGSEYQQESPSSEEDEERDTTGVDALPMRERAQVVRLTFSRSHPSFGRALTHEELPELAERRDALRITSLSSGAKVLVLAEHFTPLMEALEYVGYDPDADFKAHQVFTEVFLEPAIGEVALRVNATL